MEFLRVTCELLTEDRRRLESARNARVDGVLLGDGRADRALNGDSEEFSVPALALDMKQRLLFAAESVDVGPRAEAFRLRVFGESGPFPVAMRERLRPPERCPAELDLATITRRGLHPAVVRFRDSMTAEIVPGTERRIDLVSDEALVFLGSCGAMLLMAHDDDIPLNLRITTSPRVIERALSRALEVRLL